MYKYIFQMCCEINLERGSLNKSETSRDHLSSKLSVDRQMNIISHYMYVYTYPFLVHTLKRKSLGQQHGETEGVGVRRDNLLYCQYVAHNDRLLDFSDMAIIVAADLDRSSLA